MKQNYLKKFLPHIVAVTIFLIISIILFSPIIKGKELQQSDMMNYFGVVKELDDYEKKTGDGSYWINSLFSGMPSLQIKAPTQSNIFVPMSEPLKLWGWELNIGVVFLYMIGFYIIMTALGVSPWLSLLAGISFALASYNIIIIEVGHITKAWAMAMMAPILGSMILIFRKKYLVGIPIFIVALGLQINFNHIQITYYTLLAALSMGIVYFIYSIKDKTLKSFAIGVGIMIIGAIISLMPNSASMVLNQEYVSHTMRGGSEITVKPQGDYQTKNEKGLSIDYAYQWSYGIGESLSVLIPDARGGGSSDQRYEKNAKNRISLAQTTPPARGNDPNINQVFNQYVASSYWGEQPFTAGTVYFGSIIIFLSLLGFLLINSRERWWLLIATIIGFVLAWGNNFLVINEWLFYNLPLYNKFRTPSMALVLSNATLIIVAFMGLKEFFSDKIDSKKKLKSLYISAGVAGGIALIAGVLPDMFASFSSSKDKIFEDYLGQAFIQALYEDRKAMFVSDAWRSFILIALSFASLYLFAAKKIKSSNIIVLILGVLIIFDLWGVSKRYLTEDNFKKKQELSFFASPADEEIYRLNQENNINHYRVYNLTVNTFNDATTSYFHPSIGGYHGAKLQRYQDLIDFYMLNPNYRQLDLSDTSKLRANQLRQIYFQFQGQIPPVNFGVLSMLDAKYFILPLGENGQGVPIQNSEACGAAWFVPSIDWAKDANEEIQKLDNFSPKEKAIIDVKFKDIVKPITGFDPNATVVFEKDANNNPQYLKYTTNSSTDGILIMSEIYYDEFWKCYIDGVETPYFRANYVLRGVSVPKGKHIIEFKLESQTQKTFNIIALLGSILVVLIILACIGYPIYKKRKQK
ncbi:MAG: hypothetical protein PHY55_07780 [Bacteroidales bacterium]|nr:hypothetical protein [Bacteroidales bacterium]